MHHGCQNETPALTGALVKAREADAQGGENTLSLSYRFTCLISISLNYEEKHTTFRKMTLTVKTCTYVY